MNRFEYVRPATVADAIAAEFAQCRARSPAAPTSST
jgi:hypothetical protein